MTRLIGAILALGLLSGCATYFKMDDEIAFSGQGVLASYDQSIGELTDTNRVNVSVNKKRMKPVELASSQAKFKELADFGDLTIEERKRKARPSTVVPFGRALRIVQ